MQDADRCLQLADWQKNYVPRHGICIMFRSIATLSQADCAPFQLPCRKNSPACSFPGSANTLYLLIAFDLSGVFMTKLKHLSLLSLLLLISVLALPCPGAAQPESLPPGEESTTLPSASVPLSEALQMVSDPTRWLLDAVRRSSGREVQAALSQGARLTQECLWLAAIHADAAVLDYLLKEAGTAPGATFSIGIEAGEGQDATEDALAIRRRLMSLLSSDGHQKDPVENVNLLHCAALVGNMDTARYLLNAGVNPSAAMSNGMTPVLVGFCSWLRTWNPMHVTPLAIRNITRDCNYPGYIYALFDHGVHYSQLEGFLEEKRDILERYVVTLAQNFMVPMKDGSMKRLEDLLDDLCTNTAWGLLDQHLFVQEYENYCNMRVLFIGRLKSDGTSICLPFAFVDERFVIPGDTGSAFVRIWHNGETLTRIDSLRYLDAMGIDLQAREFWEHMDAQFSEQ